MLTNMIEYLRFALYGLVIFLAMTLYQAWDKEHAKPVTIPTTQTDSSKQDNYIPAVDSNNTATPITASVNKVAPVTSVTSTHLIHVTTNTMEMDIDAAGGNITQVKLLQYPQEVGSTQPVVLLNNDEATKYIAQSGLLSNHGPDTSNGQALYTSESNSYSLQARQNDLPIQLTWQDGKGLKVTKTLTVHRDSYEVDVAYRIENQTNQSWEGNTYLQLLRKNAPTEGSKGLINLATYFGAAIYDPQQKQFKKITYKQMQQSNLNTAITGGWAAMIQHYFVSAWVPDSNIQGQYFSHVSNDGLYTIGMLGPKFIVAPGTALTTNAKFYSGPSIAKNLEKVAPGLPLTIDFGIFWIIAVAIFWLMQKIHAVIGNWGWSIVLVTLAIKLMFYHLSAKSYRSMSAMKNLQPKLNTLKERYGADKQKFSQATIELYKKEKINPMSGCLPILIQIPVFIGLYWVLIESVELRQAPFILWIQDLSQKDPYYLLPVLMGISMFLQQRLNPPPADPVQAKVMLFMPVIFTALFMNFPAGLMLYWFVNNSLSFLQQWYVMRSINGKNKLIKA